jgi:hypothetical protein
LKRDWAWVLMYYYNALQDARSSWVSSRIASDFGTYVLKMLTTAEVCMAVMKSVAVIVPVEND